MLQKSLGKTGIKISEIGQGTWAFRGGVEPLKVGVSLGATHVDTAEMYGTEGVVGKAIADIRDKVFLATKVSPQHLHYDDLIKAAEGSLSRLDTKILDLYMIHWPNPRIPIKETMKAMEDLVKKGKIRHIGVSNFSVEDLKEAQAAMSSQEIVSNQVEYNLATRGVEDELIPFCKEQKITIVAYSPLSRGQVSKKKDEVLDKIASKYGKTIAQVALNFLTREENVVAIPKTDNTQHVKENCEASGWRLSEADIKLIDARFR
ncbi:MAG TPA: aldo/keto reductase [Nitrososphaerales archaeon]|nr:aldo/keto reductase [Nitrososphaerales archaeon]